MERAFPARSSRRLSSRSSLSSGERIMSWSTMCDLIYLRSCRINRSSLSTSLSNIAPVRLFLFPHDLIRSTRTHSPLTSLTFVVQNINPHRNRLTVCSSRFYQAPYGCRYKWGLCLLPINFFWLTIASWKEKFTQEPHGIRKKAIGSGSNKNKTWKRIFPFRGIVVLEYSDNHHIISEAIEDILRVSSLLFSYYSG